MIQTLALIIAFLSLIGGILTVWVKINVKVKELEIKILGMENKFIEVKEERKEDFKLFNASIEKIWEKLDRIDTKLDAKFEDLAVIKAEHQRNICLFSPTEKKDK